MRARNRLSNPIAEAVQLLLDAGFTEEEAERIATNPKPPRSWPKGYGPGAHPRGGMMGTTPDPTDEGGS